MNEFLYEKMKVTCRRGGRLVVLQSIIRSTGRKNEATESMSLKPFSGDLELSRSTQNPPH